MVELKKFLLSNHLINCYLLIVKTPTTKRATCARDFKHPNKTKVRVTVTVTDPLSTFLMGFYWVGATIQYTGLKICGHPVSWLQILTGSVSHFLARYLGQLK